VKWKELEQKYRVKKPKESFKKEIIILLLLLFVIIMFWFFGIISIIKGLVFVPLLLIKINVIGYCNER